MIQGFVRGVLLGGAAALLGLGVVSQFSAKSWKMVAVEPSAELPAADVPLPAVTEPAPAPAQSAPETVEAPEPEAAAPEAAPDENESAAPVTVPATEPATPTPTPTPTPTVAEPAEPAPAQSTEPAPAAPEAAAPPAEAVETPAEPPADPPAEPIEAASPSRDVAAPAEPAFEPAPAPAAPAETPPARPDDKAPAATPSPGAVETPPNPEVAEASPAAPATQTAPVAPVAEAAPETGVAPDPAPAPSDDAMLEPAPGVTDAAPAPGAIAMDNAEPAPAPPAQSSEPSAEPEALPTIQAPSTLDDNSPSTLAPSGSLLDRKSGVTTGRLPRIGGTETTEAPAAEADLPAVQRFARAFEGGQGKPLFVILLRDIGAAGMARADLANLPFAVSFVIDPAAPDAAEAARTYRAAGQEVLMLATGIPDGATAGDLEQTFQSHAATLPEAVAVIETEAVGFQDNRPLASLVVPVIKAQGRGLVTFDKGLNAADQIARRDGVPAATIFRALDAESESASTIRRYLDRAAFKAAQEGRVMVIGDTRPETVAAILEWTIEGRGASVALAPATAMMLAE